MPFLVLSGYRRGRCHLVRVDQKNAWLTRTQFQALCTLVSGRLTRTTEPTPLPPVLVHRLRKALKLAASSSLEVLGLIETEAHGWYRLSISSDAVALDPTFERLAECRAISQTTFRVLSRRCTRLRRSAIK
jgi:hypothetical protein